MASQCDQCNLIKNYNGSLPDQYRCKCNQRANSALLALVASYINNSRALMTESGDGTYTRHYQNIEQGIRSHQRVVRRNNQVVEAEYVIYESN